MAGDRNIIYGRQPLLEALDSGKQIEKIFLQRDLGGLVLNEISKKARQLEVPVQKVPKEKLNRLTKGNHQGMVAFFSSVRYYKIEDVVPQIYEKGEIPLILVLDEITDVRNIGAIARTAVGAAAHAIVVPAKNAAPITADAIKTSAGALNKINICRHPDLKGVIKFLQLSGIQVIAMEGRGNKLPQEIDMTVPIAIVMGSEDTGISNDLLKKVDHLVKLPMPGNFESYNVSVATGMVLYEAMRQRQLS